MKHIIIKSIRMVNFQAFKDKTIEFNDSENTIRGQNATGKTTVIRAFNWLLFNKDQFGQTDFSIKPLQKTGEPIHNVDSEVTAELISGDEEITLKKVYHEKWVKPRGQADAVFSGHESLYYFNGVPVTMREYNSKVESICPEQLFRLLTNPLYFPSLPWQEQRKLLFEICGNISDEEIAAQQKAWTDLLNTINGHKTMDEYKREIASEKRKIKEDLEKIPARIDEVQKSIPEIEEDWTAIEKAINDRSEEIKTIDREISDLSTRVEGDNEKYLSNLRLLNTKRGELQRLEFDIQFKAGQRYVELNGLLTFNVEKLKSLKAEQERLTRSSQNLEQEKQQYLNERGILLKEWQEISKQKEVFFMEEEFVCPTCKRALEAEDIETKKANLTAAWNTDKAKRLEKNVTKGKEVAAFIQQTTEKITGINQKLVELSNNINATEEKIRADDEELVKAREQKDNWQLLAKDNKDYIELNHVINLLSKSLGAGPVKADISKQTERKEAIQKELTDLIQRLNQKEFTDRAKKRIAELKKGQKDLAQKLADRELVEHNIQGFIKAKIEAIEGKVNSMFSYVSWRMFKQLVNGESEETCEAMINGVPFSDANSGAKIHAGFDIIKVLSKHYGMTAPCFVDNSESLSEFPKTESQTIKLYVTEDETLIIN